MIIYLIKSSLCLLLLLTVYQLLLEKEKMFRYNRAYLLFSLVFSFTVPFIPMVDYFQSVRLNDSLQVLPAGISQLVAPGQTTAVAGIQEAPPGPIPVSAILLTGYCIAALGFLIRFIRNIYLIRLRSAMNPHISLQGARIVLVPEKVVSHTFCTTIFISEAEYRQQGIEPEVLAHELAHVKQRHSIDILFVETLQIIFWFNPLLIFCKRAIRLNHEFLADEAVINKYHDPKQYQHLLLNKVSPANHLLLSSPLNYKITKKRLIMMTTTNNPKSIVAKKFAVAPLLLGALFLFSTHIQAQPGKSPAVLKIDTVQEPGKPGEHALVLIDGKEYPYGILSQISPSAIRTKAVYYTAAAVKKYGPKAADGAIILTTFSGRVRYMTPVERENQVKEEAAKTGFYHRITLKKEDGSSYDKLFINRAEGMGAMSCTGKKDCKAGFLVGNKLYNEDQIGEVEKLVETLPVSGTMGVGGNTVKKIRGLDLSGYAVIFYFELGDAAKALNASGTTGK